MVLPIKFYYDLMSPPSRVLYMLIKLNKLPFELVKVALRRGEHFSEAYKNINPFQKVPCIDDNGFKLSESIAIIRYLKSKDLISDQWYPSESKARARVDEFLEWQQNALFAFGGIYFYLTWRAPFMGQKSDPKLIEFARENVEKSLEIMENIWLKSNKFVAGDTITVSDLFGACLVEQLKLAGYILSDNQPKFTAWMDAVKKEVGALYDEAHEYAYKAGKTVKL